METRTGANHGTNTFVCCQFRLKTWKIRITSEIVRNHDVAYSLRLRINIRHVTGLSLIFKPVSTPGSNPLTLHCDQH